jgi:hypothetical protein
MQVHFCLNATLFTSIPLLKHKSLELQIEIVINFDHTWLSSFNLQTC